MKVAQPGSSDRGRIIVRADAVLDGYRQAEQRSGRLPRSMLQVALACGLENLIGLDSNEGVEGPGVRAACQQRAGIFFRGELTAADRCDCLDGTPVDEITPMLRGWGGTGAGADRRSTGERDGSR